MVEDKIRFGVEAKLDTIPLRIMKAGVYLVSAGGDTYTSFVVNCEA
jgi:hypothetical protein